MRRTKHHSIPPPTPETLAKAALHYLARYAASEKSLRRTLENRIRRAALRNKEFAANKTAQQELRKSIDGIVERHKKSGALNDSAYARVKVISLRRAGRSARAIQQRLGHAGVDRDVIKNALANDEDGLDPAEIEIKAATALARRRRLGPFRPGRADPLLFRKDLAALARAGFALDVARKVLTLSREEGEGRGPTRSVGKGEGGESAA